MPHLLLIGGGHAHMLTLANIGALTARGHRVTVVGPDDYHYYSGMGPGVLGGTYEPDEIRFHTAATVRAGGGEFIRATVRRIDPEAQTVTLDSGATLSWDVLSCNAGSYVPRLEMVRDCHNVFAAKPISRMVAARERILALGRELGRALTIAVIGGGPSAAEIAGNVCLLAKTHRLPAPRVVIHAGEKGLMARFPAAVRHKVRQRLTAQGVEIVSARADAVHANVVRAGDRETRADLIFMATGVKPSPLFKDSGLSVGPDGGLLVNRRLQAVDRPAIFGGGDCIYFAESPLDKVGVYAVRQNPILYHNLAAALDNRPPIPFSPGGGYLLIFNLGGTGVLHKHRLTIGGRPAFLIKDWIDRRFIRRFQ